MGKSIELTYEEIMSNPEYERFREAAVLLQNSRFEDLFPEKHLLGLKSLVHRKLWALYNETPSLPLKDVVTHVLETLPDDTSSAVVMELTRFAIEKWEAMAAKELAEV
ncbi:MAG: hypothetical protein ACKVUS_00160 [Saprospiraceae bacterium]